MIVLVTLWFLDYTEGATKRIGKPIGFIQLGLSDNGQQPKENENVSYIDFFEKLWTDLSRLQCCIMNVRGTLCSAL